MERLKQVPLWQWGLIVMIAGLMSNVIPTQGPAPNAAAALGALTAVLLFEVVGIGLIIAHFVRRQR